jgi:carboxymethylenebutenolidase
MEANILCDSKTEKDIDEFQGNKGKLTQREFAKLSAASGLGAMLPQFANAREVSESDVMVSTPDGQADCYFVYPSSGKHPAAVIWPDILGLRPAFRSMAKRLAESGYAVLVINPYYRNEKSPVVGPGASFREEATKAIVLPLYGTLNAETHFIDAKAFVAFLDEQDAVDMNRKIGSAGYCMGGPMVMRIAAAVPERIGAIASFHGGGLATDDDDSPHLLIAKTNASVLHAMAENDDENDPESKNTLKAAYAAANISAEIEVYAGTLHGWCPPDSVVYNEAQAERAWACMLALFKDALV